MYNVPHEQRTQDWKRTTERSHHHGHQRAGDVDCHPSRWINADPPTQTEQRGMGQLQGQP